METESTKVYIGTAAGLALGLLAGVALTGFVAGKTKSSSSLFLLIPLATATAGSLFGRSIGKKWEMKSKAKK